MRVVDDAIVALLETTGIDINTAFVDVDYSGQVVTFPTPYITYTSNVGDDHNERLSGHRGRRSVFFSLMYVGLTYEQAKGAGEAAHQALYRQRVSGAGITKSWLIEIETTQRVRRIDDVLRPDGKPLYYGVSEGHVSVTLNSEGVPG